MSTAPVSVDAQSSTRQQAHTGQSGRPCLALAGGRKSGVQEVLAASAWSKWPKRLSHQTSRIPLPLNFYSLYS